VAAIEPLCDFPAGIAKVQTMADGSPRIVLDLPESAIEHMTTLAQMQSGERYLYVVIYDAEEFEKALR